jgi:ATP-binding cassette subfamily B protein
VYLQDYAKDLRLTNIFQPILKSFHEAADAMRATSKIYGKKIAFTRFIRTVITELIVYLATQGLVVYRYLYHGAYSLGALTTLLNAVSNLTRLQGSISWAMGGFYENGMFVENFKVFLEYETKMPEDPKGEAPEKGIPTISLKDVSFTYEGASAPVLQNISMEIAPGEKIALVGHNGAGKSTFVKLLMRLYDVTEGEILLNGVNIKQYRLSRYRELFGTIFQDFRIFATTISENVLLFPPKKEEDKLRAIEAVKASGIYSKIQSLEKGMESQLTKEFDEKGVLLSGGEFQKLAIARVFAKESPIAILDEPSSALDPISEYEVFENMLKACEGKTVIFVSHRLSSAIMADKIYMLEEGSIIEQGSHEELMKKQGKYAQMFSMQAERYREEAVYEA